MNTPGPSLEFRTPLQRGGPGASPVFFRRPTPTPTDRTVSLTAVQIFFRIEATHPHHLNFPHPKPHTSGQTSG